MTYSGILNFEKAQEWNLSKSASILMVAFANMDRWASKCKSDDKEDSNVYYLLYRAKILADLPILGSLSSVSRAIKELESKDILKSINKNTQPAYCLSSKGLTWKKGNINTEKKTLSSKPKPLFMLKKVTQADKLDEKYYNLLAKHAYELCSTKNIDKGEFPKFIDHYLSSGKGFINWFSAFRNWIRKYQELNKPADRGLYK